MQAYRIVDWMKRYEVTNKGHVAKEDTRMEDIRTTNLSYVRLVVYGSSLSAGYRRMVKKAWALGSMMEMACFGLFIKLVEMAADQERKYRGWILDDRQRPINAAQISELLDIHDSKVQELLEVLTDDEVRWIELAEFPVSLQNNIPKVKNVNIDKLPAGPGIPGKSGTLNNVTETEVPRKELNETKPPGKSGSSRQIREPDGGRESVQPPALPAQPSVSATDPASITAPASEKLSGSDSISVPDTATVSGAGPAGPGADNLVPLSGRERLFEISRACQKTTLAFTEIIHPRTSSDMTTINDIFSQLQQRLISGCQEPLFDMAINMARECCRVGDKPIAMFVGAMKKPPFCYVPKKLSVIPGKFSQIKNTEKR